MYSIGIRHLYTLQSDHPNKSSTHIPPYIAITLLTVFPMLYFTSCDDNYNWQFVLLNSFYLSNSFPQPSHNWQTSICSLYL